MNEHETLADIIVKKRKYADEIERKAQEYIARSERVPGAYQSGIVYNIRSEADRLDRARMKMEIEMVNLRKENAKLREALEESRRIASDLGGCRLNDYWKLNEIVRVCEAALATTSIQTTQEDNQ